MQRDGRPVRCAFSTEGLGKELLETGCIRPALAKYAPDTFNWRMKWMLLISVKHQFEEAEPESLAETMFIGLMLQKIREEMDRRWQKCLHGSS